MITVKTSQVKPNPRNPRVIKDDKYLGFTEHQGILNDNEIAWENRIYINSGIVLLKKKYKATDDKPIMIIKYNLQGKLQ